MRPLVLACLLLATVSVAGPDGGTAPSGTIGLGSIGTIGRVEGCAKRVRVDDAHLRCDDPPAPRELTLERCARTSVTETKTSLTLSCENDAGVTRSVTLQDPKTMHHGGYGSGKPRK